MILYIEDKEKDVVEDIILYLANNKPTEKTVVISPSYRQSKEILKNLEEKYESIKGEYQEDNCKIDKMQIYFFPVDMDGSKIRSFRARHIIVNNYRSINQEALETIIRGYLVSTSNPIEEIKRIKGNQNG
jgi:hypothetical protein